MKKFKYQDKSKMFKDFNFKLIVINSLLHCNPSFIETFNSLKHTEELLPFLENILLNDEDMDKVKCIQFGNNLEIYTYIPIDFNHEVQSIEDIDLLYNLQSIEYE